MRGLLLNRFYFSLMVSAAVFYCGRSSSGGSGDRAAAGSEDAQIFFSAANPGKWQDYKTDHQVGVAVKSKGDYQTITITVPFKATAEHYVEAIVIVDGKNRELAKQTFERSDKAEATFNLKINPNEPVFAVAKCNQHDMWRTKIE
jgi:desulfoferrodoxin (superoxide reductase-like protein)